MASGPSAHRSTGRPGRRRGRRDGSGSALPGLGLSVTSGQLVPATQWAGADQVTQGHFVRTDGSGGTADLTFVDGVFLPKNNTPIDSNGTMFAFPNTTGWRWDAIRNAFAIYQDHYGLKEIRLADHPGVSRRGLGLHANQGITFDLDAIRNTGNQFAAITGVAGINDDAPSNVPLEIWVIVDGQQRYRHPFTFGGEFNAFSIPLGTDDHLLTLASADVGSNTARHGVIADAYLVPEPTSIALVAFALLGLRGRRT